MWPHMVLISQLLSMVLRRQGFKYGIEYGSKYGLIEPHTVLSMVLQRLVRYVFMNAHISVNMALISHMNL